MIITVFVVDGREDRGELPETQSCTEVRGTVACKADVFICPVDVALSHKQVGKFPHGPLIHDGVAHITYCRLREPVHHLCRVVALLEFQVTVESGEGVGM